MQLTVLVSSLIKYQIQYWGTNINIKTKCVFTLYVCPYVDTYILKLENPTTKQFHSSIIFKEQKRNIKQQRLRDSPTIGDSDELFTHGSPNTSTKRARL